jgi:hypothetical protein
VKKFFVFTFFIFVIVRNCFALDYMLPFQGGSTFKCSQGWDGNVSHYGAWEHSWDFPMKVGTPIIAPVDATVVFSGTGYNSLGENVIGETIILDYGNNEYGKFCHLSSRLVCSGNVEQGSIIGYSGNTGTSSTGPHLHYNVQNGPGLWDASISSTFIDAEENSRIPIEGHSYTSMNTYNPYNTFKVGRFIDGWRVLTDFNNPYSGFTPLSRPFVLTYKHYGGLDILGAPVNNVYKATVFDLPGYNISGSVDSPWMQDIENTSATGHWLTLVLNPFVENKRIGHFDGGYHGVVFPIHGQIRDYWRLYYSQYGPPACNEYYETINGKLYVVQWFMKGNSSSDIDKIVYDTSDGSFNDPETASLTYGNHLEQSVYENIGCPDGVCGVGGYFITAPYNVQASAVSDTEVQLTWTLPITNPENYHIKVYNDNDVLLKDISATNSVVMDNLSAGTEYCYYVTLLDSVLNIESEESEIVCATTNSLPLPPPVTWSVERQLFASDVDINSPHDPYNINYSYQKYPGFEPNYWVKVASTDPNLSFEWKLYYVFDNSRIYDANQGGSATPSYYGESHSYYDTVNQEYVVWHTIEANSLGYFGQYRAELWINGQKASNCLFDLTMKKPSNFNISAGPSQTSVSLFWSTLGDSTEGSGVELFRDSEMIAFIPGISSGYTDSNLTPGEEYEYRIRAVEAQYAGDFLSPFSDALIVNALPAVTPLDTYWWVGNGTIDYQENTIDFSISSLPANPWDVTFGRNFAVESGQIWQLKFKAKAQNYSGNGMQIEIAMNDNGPSWGIITNQEFRTITDTEVEYTIDLYINTTDPTAMLFINVGYATGDLSFSDISLNLIQSTPQSSPLGSEWSSANGNINYPNNTIEFQIPTLAANPWDYSFSRELAVEAGQTWQLKFNASADSYSGNGMLIELAMNDNGPSWGVISNVEQRTITNTEIEYTVDIVANVTDSSALFFVNVGHSIGNLNFSNISLEMVSTTPLVTPLSQEWWIGGGTIDYLNAEIEFQISNLPSNPWDITFGRNLAVEAGQIWRLKFNAVAENYSGSGMQIEAAMNDNGPAWALVTNQEYRTITDTESEYIIDLTVNTTDSTAMIFVNVGYNVGDLNLSNVTFELISP